MNVKATLGAFKFKCKQHSPEILMIGGVLTMIAGTVVAVKKAERHAENVAVKENNVNAWSSVENYPEEEVKSEIKKEIRRYVVEEVKIWSVPIAIEAGGAALIFASNHIMRKRIAGLSATLVTVSTAFDQYRERVRERYGEEVDESILLGEKQVTIGTIDEKGKVKKETITVADPDVTTIGRYFTKSNPNFSASDSFVNDFFDMQQRYLTDKLNGIGFGNSGGFVLLNDIYDALGFELDTEAGITVGKIYDRDSCDNQIIISRRKKKILDEYGNPEEVWYVDFPGLEIIYGKGKEHRSITT